MNRIFSGVQPTGSLHLGNYLGAIKNFVKLQSEHLESVFLYCVVDMHAITVWQDPVKLKSDIRETAAAFLAVGVDPEKSIIFNQSKVSAHAELAWILNCVSRLGWLNRMTQFKEKAGKKRENASVGLYTYPVLMAADILSYKANLVPVGDDQKQHLELARDIAQKFNFDFKINFFPEVKPLIMSNDSRIMSLRNGKDKMSKSDISDFSRINLSDTKDEIAMKIKKAKTDNGIMPNESSLNKEGDFLKNISEERPEIVNLIRIYCSLSGLALSQTINKLSDLSFSQFKNLLIDLVVETLVPIGKEIKKIEKDHVYVENILQKGAERAEKIATPTLKEIKKIIGFL